MKRRVRSDDGFGNMATALGLFSIGLGVAEIVAPRQLSKLIGVDARPTLMRMFGIREMMSGVGILSQKTPGPWLWSRVAGDGMDLTMLGFALTSKKSNKAKVLAATSAVAGVTAIDVMTAVRTTSRGRRQANSIITVNVLQRDVYEFWRKAENLARFIKSVRGPFEIVTARPNEFIEWRSVDENTVRAASAAFGPAKGREGTEVYVVVDGRISQLLLHEDLRRFKRLLETGEIPTTEGQSAGPSATAVMAPLIHRLEGKEIA